MTPVHHYHGQERFSAKHDRVLYLFSLEVKHAK